MQKDSATVQAIDSIRELLITQSDLTFLEKLDQSTLDSIRDEIAAYIKRTEEAQRPLFKVMAVATKLIPNFIIAKMN